MTATTKLFLALGGINALIAVGLGAFGAHALRSVISTEMMETYQTGIRYHFYHALGLMIIALVAFHLPSSALIKWSGWVMFAGIVLFSGSLYILSLSGMTRFGAVTPLGGVAFIAAWVLLVIGVLK